MPALIELYGRATRPFAAQGSQYRWSRRVSLQGQKPPSSPARSTRSSAATLPRPTSSVGRVLGLFLVVAALTGGVPLSALAQPKQPRLVTTFQSEAGGIGYVRFSPDGKTLAIETLDGLVLWEVATRQVRARLDSRLVLMITFAPDGNSLATPGWGAVRLWNLVTRKSKLLPVGDRQVTCVAFSPDGKSLACGENPDGGVKLLDVVTGRELASLDARQYVSALAFSPDGKMLAATGLGGRVPPVGRVWLWDVAGRRLRTTIEVPIASASPAFSSDGQTLAFSQADTVQLRDPATGRLRASWKFGSSLASGLVFSPDGRVLVAGGGENEFPGFIKGFGEVKFWDVTAEKEILTLQTHGESVRHVALSPEGKLLAVSTGKPSLPMSLWDVSAVTGRLPSDPRPAPVRAQPDPVNQGPVSAGNLTPEELKKLWSDLAGKDTPQAYRALWALVGAPQQAVAFLARKLQPVPPTDLKGADRLIADLESDQFAVRQQAILELEKAGAKAEPALRKVLQGKPRLETRERVQQLLTKLDGPVTGEQLRALRSIEVLEYIGSAEARQILETLAKGAPHARVTQEALLTLERLAQRPASAP